jgi:hypothetical protein
MSRVVAHVVRVVNHLDKNASVLRTSIDQLALVRESGAQAERG